MNLFKLIATISLLTFFSRILGLIRDTLIVSIFGIGTTSDAFFIAFKLPNFLRRIFAEGAFSQAFIPILIKYKNQKNKEKTKKFISYTFGILILILFIISFLGIFFSNYLVMIIAPGFITIPEKFNLTSLLLSIIFPYIMLISIASLFGTILNVWNNFFIPAFSPIFFNLVIISLLIFISPYFKQPVLILAYSILLGGIMQIIYQIPFLKKIDMLVLPRINIRHLGVCKVIKHIGPAIIGVSASQISLVINTIFSSFLVSGSVSWIYYADRLIELPSGILGVTLSTILLPYLSKTFFDGNKKEYLKLMDWGLRLSFLLVIPSAIGLAILAQPIVTTLFQYGKFNNFDVLMTQRILVVYSIGLPGLILVKVLAPGFYSQQDISTPVKISIICLICTQLMNLLLIKFLKHTGLAISIGIAAYLNAALLYFNIIKKKIFFPQPGWCIFFLKLFISVIFMSIILICTKMMIQSWEIGSVTYKVVRLLLVCFLGGSSYFVMLFIMGFRIKKLFMHHY